MPVTHCCHLLCNIRRETVYFVLWHFPLLFLRNLTEKNITTLLVRVAPCLLHVNGLSLIRCSLFLNSLFTPLGFPQYIVNSVRLRSKRRRRVQKTNLGVGYLSKNPQCRRQMILKTTAFCYVFVRSCNVKVIFISFTNIWNAQKLDLFFKVVGTHYNRVRGLFGSLSRKYGIEVEIRFKEFLFFLFNPPLLLTKL